MPENGDLAVGSEQHFFRIGQVCRLTDIKSFTLRYWESEFPTLAPVKSSKGQRLYRREDVETVLRIKRLLYDEGFTIAGARRYLRDLDHAPLREATQYETSGARETVRETVREPELPPRAAAAARDAVASHPDAASALAEDDQESSQFAGSSAPQRAAALRPPAAPSPAPSSSDAAGKLSRKLLLDLRDSLRAFLTLLENE